MLIDLRFKYEKLNILHPDRNQWVRLGRVPLLFKNKIVLFKHTFNRLWDQLTFMYK